MNEQTEQLIVTGAGFVLGCIFTFTVMYGQHLIGIYLRP